LAEKLLCGKLSPYKFSAAVGTLYFPLPFCHRLENIKFDTWNLVLNNPAEKSTRSCDYTCLEWTLLIWSWCPAVYSTPTLCNYF